MKITKKSFSQSRFEYELELFKYITYDILVIITFLEIRHKMVFNGASQQEAVIGRSACHSSSTGSVRLGSTAPPPAYCQPLELAAAAAAATVSAHIE